MEHFDDEKQFQDNIVEKLTKQGGWQELKTSYNTSKELIANWKKIIEINNQEKEKLNGEELTDDEMKEVIEKINDKYTSPYEINRWLNQPYECSISIKRDKKKHPDKGDVNLTLFKKNDVAKGFNQYQIARETWLSEHNGSQKRGDLTLLINGMPLVHIELKKEGVNINEAIEQIKRYKTQKSFKGIFSLVQLFIVMTPSEMKYFANVERPEQFNDLLIFKWANFNNQKIEKWEVVCDQFLTTQMIHTLLTFGSVADKTDKTLKIMRSYQYHATQAICNVVKDHNWSNKGGGGGYIYHTTGSGKTLTCFKVAQILNTFDENIHKIIFLLDAVELYKQTYVNFLEFSNGMDIHNTENVNKLAGLLEKKTSNKKVIVTSIQKMSRLAFSETFNEENHPYKSLIDEFKNKNIVFIIDEAHRSTNGQMLANIKSTYNRSLFFGFTGTPIFEENKKEYIITTKGLFGEQLHRYTMLSAIEDNNVLPVKNEKNLSTYNDREVIRQWAKAKYPDNPKAEDEFFNKLTSLDIEKDPNLRKFFNEHYNKEEHKHSVVKDIFEEFHDRSSRGFFRHILATTSINNAVEYYKLFKQYNKEINDKVHEKDHSHWKALNIAITFNKNEGDGLVDKGSCSKEMAKEILDDFRQTYDSHVANFEGMKEIIANNLKRENPLEKNKINLVIVVNQLLTGFDSKYINFIYLDKVLDYHRLFQAISRTNRILTHETEYKKQSGFIKCYQRSHLMRENLKNAARLFISDNELDFFESRLKEIILEINEIRAELVKQKNISEDQRFLASEQSAEERDWFAKKFSRLSKLRYRGIPEQLSFNRKIYEFEEINSTTGDIRIEKVEYKLQKEEFENWEKIYKNLPKEVKEKHKVHIEIKSYEETISGYSYDLNNLTELYIQYKKSLDNKDAELANKIIKEINSKLIRCSKYEQELLIKLINKIESGEIKIDEEFSIKEYIQEERRGYLEEIDAILGIDAQKIQELLSKQFNDHKEYDTYADTIKQWIDDCNKEEILRQFQSMYETKVIRKSNVITIMEKYLKEIAFNGLISLSAWLSKNINEYANDKADKTA
ncbi:HsdR family type I site-specific deoxyribonuclease [Mycoplasma sp. E35C]|uniref:HsdR family type I site-specific deoxyribonuclease n=1 Tax=Mycoplasma sp. E35C TaxID=2801918 RepID=UPI001CA45177|nr:HsdR family type I site-specific deoxyribonuclease [Mycoplasma sp. E35C]QZX48900.1 type I restriction endonuclease subunit R [Mycoplasma sp. E35C]